MIYCFLLEVAGNLVSLLYRCNVQLQNQHVLILGIVTYNHNHLLVAGCFDFGIDCFSNMMLLKEEDFPQSKSLSIDKGQYVLPLLRR